MRTDTQKLEALQEAVRSHFARLSTASRSSFALEEKEVATELALFGEQVKAATADHQFVLINGSVS